YACSGPAARSAAIAGPCTRYICTTAGRRRSTARSRCYGLVVPMPQLAFGCQRLLPRAEKVPGRVVVLDIAFAATVGTSVSFELITKPFIDGLGERLAAWIDHHDHERHVDFADDPRFVLSTKAEHGACPEMVTPDRVRHAGPIDSILTHVD